MRKSCWIAVVSILAFAGSASGATWMGHLLVRDPVVWSEGRAGNYGVAKYFLDEDAHDNIPIEVTVQVYGDGQPASALEVQAFSNVNRRDFAKIWESPTDAGGATSYFAVYPMTHVGTSGNNFVYRTQLNLSKTGAYRLTARFRVNGGAWQWHNDFSVDGVLQRDCAIVVSPRKVLQLRMYEVDPLVIEATAGGTSDQRSTLEDFLTPDLDGFDPLSLEHIRTTLGFNTVWLMPIFPVTRERWDPNTRQIVSNASPGSPYATRNYFEVSEALSAAGTPGAAMTAFQQFVEKAESIGLDVFLDVAFNHAGRDVVFGQGAVDLGLAQPSEIDTQIRLARPAWATSASDFRQHANSSANVALYAPTDRLGEHTWYDAGFDWFFGSDSSLGPKPGWGDISLGSAVDERDLFYTDLDPAGGHDFEVEHVWHYFARVLPYWLERTDNRLDGIRADFAQGLPPRAWEYIINKTRQRKWDFVFLAEALDPDQIRYRVNRQFDVLTTVDHWLYRHTGVTTSQLVGSLEAEADLYGYNAAIMHNGTSHDEEGNGNAWLMAARYAVAAAVHGVPMVYMSQPLGVPYKIDFQLSWQNVAAFWTTANTQAFAVYRRINEAREQSSALRGTNRYFLQKHFGGGFNEHIFSVARWADDNIVLAFVNLRDQVVQSDVFSLPTVIPLDSSSSAKYQAFNLIADNPHAPLWPEARTAADIRQNGVFVAFSLPNEIQFIVLRKI